MELKSLKIENFKGIRELTITPNGESISIYGPNAAGKTTIFDAITWVLTGKDSFGNSVGNKFEIKTLDQDGNVIHNLEHSVTGTWAHNGKEIILGKVYKERWTRKNGSITDTFTGHTTEHFVNEVPVRASEYEQEVKSIADEDLFKLLTNPRWFNEQLEWKERRDILMKVCGDVTDEEVIKSNPELSELPSIIKDHTIEKYEKIVVAKMSKINSRIKEIPVRISEVQKTIPVDKIDYEALQNKIEKLQSQASEMTNKLAQLSSDGEAVEKQKQLAMLDTVIIRIKNACQEEKSKKINALHEEELQLINEGTPKANDLSIKKSELERTKEAIVNYQQAIVALRNEASSVLAEQFEADSVCPTCGQVMPEDKVQESKKKFNLAKSQKLAPINQNGIKTKALLEESQAKAIALESEINTLHSEVELMRAKMIEVRTKIKEINDTFDVVDDPSYNDILAEKKLLEESISNPDDSVRSENESLTKAIAQINSTISEEQSKLALKDIIEKSSTRITELSNEEKTLATEYEKFQGEKYLIDEFTKTKVTFINNNINNKFKHARFKLFNIQTNGGIDDCCEVTHNGVPYAILNNAMKTNIGIDIINTLSKHYNFSAPIIVDNAESISDLFETEAQVIRLVISKDDKSLRVEGAN